MASPRLSLAAGLRAVMPDVNVYDAPPDVVVVPAIVISPGTPYRTEVALGGRERYGFDLLLLVPRATDINAAWALLDVICDAVRTYIRKTSSDPQSWGGISFIGETKEVGGTTFLSAVAPVQVLGEEAP